MRINKLFSNLGICSRKETNRLIEAGRVKVNGELSIPGQWVELTFFVEIKGYEIGVNSTSYFYA